MEEVYTIKMLVDELMEKCGIQQTQKGYREIIRKAIERYSKKLPGKYVGGFEYDETKYISLYEATQQEAYGKNKHRHVYTQYQKQALFESEEFIVFLLDYVCTEKKKPEFEEMLKNIRDAKEQNERAMEYWDGHENMRGEDIICIPLSIYEQTKYRIMIEAIFQKFFTPINEDNLHHDVWLCQFVEGTTDHDKESEEARKRLISHHTHDRYYKPLPVDEKKFES